MNNERNDFSMNEWQYGIKKTFDDLAYEGFKKAELECLYNPTEENYNNAKEMLEICKSRNINISIYEI